MKRLYVERLCLEFSNYERNLQEEHGFFIKEGLQANESEQEKWNGMTKSSWKSSWPIKRMLHLSKTVPSLAFTCSIWVSATTLICFWTPGKSKTENFATWCARVTLTAIRVSLRLYGFGYFCGTESTTFYSRLSTEDFTTLLVDDVTAARQLLNNSAKVLLRAGCYCLKVKPQLHVDDNPGEIWQNILVCHIVREDRLLFA